MSRENVIWKPVSGTQYEVSQFGDVRHSRTKKVRIVHADKKGYMRFDYWTQDGKRKNMPIHRAVALAFIPMIEGKNDVNHMDSKRDNNYYENLEWTTRAENIKHGYDYGKATPRKGMSNGRRKLTQNQVINIRHCKGSATQALLARLYRVDQSAVSLIWSRKTWSHI
jgi:hypothetical protein